MGFGLSKGPSSKTTTDVDSNTVSAAGMNFDQGSDYYDQNNYNYGGGSNYGNQAQYGEQVFNPNAQIQKGNNMGNMWGNFMGQGGGMDRINQQVDPATGLMMGAAQGGMGAFNNLSQGGATGATGAAMDPALRDSLVRSMQDPSQTGKMYESIVGGPGNTYIDPMINAMGSDEAIRQNRMASGITGDAVGRGQTGSSRHGIAEGLMRSEGNRNLATREAEARAGAYDKDLDWKMKIAQQADLGRGQAQDRAIGLMKSGDTNVGRAMDSTGAMQEAGMGVMNPAMAAGAMPFSMAGDYAGAVGDPTVLSSGNQAGQGSQFDSGSGWGDAGGGSWGSGNSFEDYMNNYTMRHKGKSGGGFGISAGAI